MSINFGNAGKFPEDEWDDISDSLEDIKEAQEELFEARREIEQDAIDMRKYRAQVRASFTSDLQKMRVPGAYKMPKLPNIQSMGDIDNIVGFENIGPNQNYRKSVYTRNGKTTTRVVVNGKVVQDTTTEDPTMYTEFVRKPVLGWFQKWGKVINILLGKKETKNADKKEEPKKSESGERPGEVQPPKDGV